MPLPKCPNKQAIIEHIELLALAKSRLDNFIVQIKLHKPIRQLWRLPQIGSNLSGKVSFTVSKMSGHKIKYTTHLPSSFILHYYHVGFFVIFQYKTRLIWSQAGRCCSFDNIFNPNRISCGSVLVIALCLCNQFTNALHNPTTIILRHWLNGLSHSIIFTRMLKCEFLNFDEHGS